MEAPCRRLVPNQYYVSSNDCLCVDCFVGRSKHGRKANALATNDSPNDFNAFLRRTPIETVHENGRKRSTIEISSAKIVLTKGNRGTKLAPTHHDLAVEKQ